MMLLLLTRLGIDHSLLLVEVAELLSTIFLFLNALNHNHDYSLFMWMLISNDTHKLQLYYIFTVQVRLFKICEKP